MVYRFPEIQQFVANRLRALSIKTFSVCLMFSLVTTLRAASDPPRFVFSCSAENDLYRVMTADGASYPRYASAEEAIDAAPEDAGVLILAEGYPQKTTTIQPAAFDTAAKKKLRLFVEFPTALPGMALGEPRTTRLERGVVASDYFGPKLPPMRIVMINGCTFVPAEAARPYLVVARVAGVDKAVFGLDDTETHPILFEHGNTPILVSTTKLSNFVTGRYLPSEDWKIIWQTILGHLQPGAELPELIWTPTVRPTYQPDEKLPADVERQALHRMARWVQASRILRHPDWPREALDWAGHYNTVREKPADDWPLGDGSLGILEGYSSTVRYDGSQPMRYAVRNDCVCEMAMALAMDARLNDHPQNATIAKNLLHYMLVDSPLARGPRADPKSASYGLVGWALDNPNNYWGDDNARAMLGTLAAAAVMDDPSHNEAMVRCLLGNLRTTGTNGFRQACMQDPVLARQGWQGLFQIEQAPDYSPHFQSWLWACYLQAYDQTGYEPFLDRGKQGLRRMMAAYPDRWQYCNRSGSIERARLLLPLAWLVRVEDAPQHRRWLDRIATDLIAAQDAGGAIRETIGGNQPGTVSNAEYGTRETSLIQDDGNTVADMLYTCNFALIGLHEAAAATGNTAYARAENRLADFLCRIQIRSETHPELDGAWYRGFDFRRWEYWASNADWEWGPWCTETGWTQPWIAGTLGLRQMDTSLWDLLGRNRLDKDMFDRYRRQMIPDDTLESLESLSASKGQKVGHAAVGKNIELAAWPSPDYLALGARSLVDGRISDSDYTSGLWLGFHGSDLEAVLDLGQIQPVHQISARFLQSVGVGIYLPREVTIETSDDGKQYRTMATLKPPETRTKNPGPFIETVQSDKLEVRARYVRIVARNVATIPAGHPAAGQKAWLFADEILIDPVPVEENAR